MKSNRKIITLWNELIDKKKKNIWYDIRFDSLIVIKIYAYHPTKAHWKIITMIQARMPLPFYECMIYKSDLHNSKSNWVYLCFCLPYMLINRCLRQFYTKIFIIVCFQKHWINYKVSNWSFWRSDKQSHISINFK